MAEVTTRRKGEMIETLFRILAEESDGLQAKDAIGRVEVRMDLTPFERSTFPNNPDLVRFPKLLRFSTISAVKAGWLRKKGGVWTLTDEGYAALQDFPDPAALYAESWRLYKDWKASQPEPDQADASDGGGISAGAVAPAVSIDATEGGWIAAATLEEAEEAASRAIHDYLGSVISPYGFQDLVGKLLDAMGYHVVDRSQGKGPWSGPARLRRSVWCERSPHQGPSQAQGEEGDRGRASLVSFADRAG